MENKKIILPTLKHANSSEEEHSLRVELEKKEILLREGDRDIVLDLSKLFDKERNESKGYKIYGKIKMIFRNMYSGNTNYEYLRQRLYLVGDGSDGNFSGFLPYDEFAFLRRDVIRELNTPNSGSVLGSFTQNLSLVGSSGHTLVTSITAPYQNWNLYLSYVYTGDTTYPISYTLTGGTDISFTAEDGIPFRVSSNGNYYKLTSPIEHGMSEGEFIVVSGGTLNNSVPISGRTFHIDSVGDEYHNSEKYVVNVLKNEFTTGTTLSTVILGKRCTDRNNISLTLSKYYVHKHKTLTDINGYIMDKVGFESALWEDEKKIIFENSAGVNDLIVERNRMESVLFDFKEPFILTGLTNNLGYTPTDVYVTMIFRNGEGYFDYPPKIGYKFNFHDSWIDNHFSGTTSNEITLTGVTFTGNTSISGYTGYTFISGQTLPKGSILVGAFVEYNEYELKERIVSETFHKIVTPVVHFDFEQDNPAFYSGASANNLVGLYYQPHHRIKLRELSPYMETAKMGETIIDLPENTKYFKSENIWKWRDLYDHGYVDPDGNGTNFPFLNDVHNVKLEINFYLRNEKQYINKSDGLDKFNYIGKKKKKDC
jgi:hypothetical protein